MSADSTEKSGGKLAIVLLFAAAAIAVVVFAVTSGGGKPEPQQVSGGGGAGNGGAGNGGGAGGQGGGATQPKVTVDLLYSTEKEAWILESVQAFERAHGDVDVVPKAMGSLSAAKAIVEGQAKPTLWTPADNVALNLAADDWYQKYHKALFVTSGDGAPQPLVLTPLVLVAWEERAKVLTADGAEKLSWKRIQQVLAAPEGWKSIGGDPNWGLIRLGHTDPSRSNSGLQALLLMAHEFYGKTTPLQVADVVNADFQAFLKSIEIGVPSFGDSTGTFMRDMILYGPSKYDVVVTYENLAIEQLPNAQGRWGNLRVYYPHPTMWSSHPLALLEGDWVSPEQRQKALELAAFLRSSPVQLEARKYGYRPADPSIKILDDSPTNPFKTATQFGIRPDVPPIVDAPAGPVIQNLIEVWSRLVKR